MPDNPTGGGSFPEDRYRNPETALGGADAVEKTTYVTGQGTEPEARHQAGTPSARSARCSPAWSRSALLIVTVIVPPMVWVSAKNLSAPCS